MKKINLFLIAILSIVLIGFSSCDDDSPKKSGYHLVVVKRGDGTIHSIDKTTGDLTQIGVLKNENGAVIKGARALDYNPDSKKAYIGSTNSDSASFYMFDYKTGVATFLSTDPNNDTKDGISGVLIRDNGNVLVNMYSNNVGQSAIAEFNGITGAEGTHYGFLDGNQGEVWSTGGLIFGDSNSEVVIGGEEAIYFSDLHGLVSDTTEVKPTTNLQAGSGFYVTDLAKDENGDVYALIILRTESPLKNNGKFGDVYLTKIDMVTGDMIEVAKLASGSNTEWFHCLAFIPEN